jgi:DNA-binding transcriptional ArsR family regulator
MTAHTTLRDGPHIARVAALIGDPARAEVLSALMADRALTATELATLAGVGKATLSVHLAKLVDAGLITMSPQGRHRYFRLANADVAQALEALMGVAFRTGAVRVRSSPREPALRLARVCYDHLAGELGVEVYEALLARRVFMAQGDGVQLSAAGQRWFATLGIDATALAQGRRSLCRPCLDWSERRSHLGGALGAALLTRLFELGWARRERDSRVLRFSPNGLLALREQLAARPATPGQAA